MINCKDNNVDSMNRDREIIIIKYCLQKKIEEENEAKTSSLSSRKVAKRKAALDEVKEIEVSICRSRKCINLLWIFRGTDDGK